MTAILADENLDHRVVHRLEHYGHDVGHVDIDPELSNGCDDTAIARRSLDTGRVRLTSDDVFLADFGTEDVAGLLFLDDESFQPATIADIVHEIVTRVDDPAGQVYYVSRNWL